LSRSSCRSAPTSWPAADVQELVARGVVFDELELGEMKLVAHVMTSPGIGKSAWVKDPDGTTLALYQPE